MNLHELGLGQGVIIPCGEGLLENGFGELLKDSRAIIGARTKPILDTDLLLVLSQDCDIASKGDKYIELIPLRNINDNKVNSHLQRSRNFRKLQIEYNGKAWLLESEKIAVIPKSELPNISYSEMDYLDDRNIQLVLDWRVSRYNRKPLPDNFNRAFLDYVRNDPELSLYLEQNRETIFDLYVYIDPHDVEDADEYNVIVTALIDQQCEEVKENEIHAMLKKHWGILHNKDNCLRMGQIDEAFAPDTLDISNLIVSRLADFSFLDNYFLTKITLDFLCYDEIIVEN